MGGSEGARRRNAISKGGRPRVSQYIERRYITLRQIGDGQSGSGPLSQAKACERVGISVSTGKRIEGDYKFKVKQMLLPPPPVPYDELPPEAKQALGDFNFFRAHYKKRDPVPWAGIAADTLLELYHSGEDQYVLLNEAPGVGKTTVLTDDFVEWAVLLERAHGREITCLLGHRTQLMSRRYVRRIKHSFEHNREILMDFGRLKPEVANATWSQDELLVEPIEWDDIQEKDPTISCTSQESGFIGGRYKLVVFDDLVDKHNSRSFEGRAELVNIFETEAETRLNTPGLFVLSGARYGPEDLFHNRAQLVSIEDFDPDGRPKHLYSQIKFPAHFDDKCNGVTHEGDWPHGCLLDAKRAPWKKLVAFKSRDEGRYRLVWQQEDVDPKGSLADPKWFDGGTDVQGWEAPGCFDRFRAFGQLPDRDDKQRPLVSMVTLDPAGTGYWAMSHWLVYPGRVIVNYRGIRRRMDAPDVLYRQLDGTYTGYLEEWRLAAEAAHVPFHYFVAEKNGVQRWLTQYEFMRTWFSQHNIVVIPHETSWNKRDPDKGVSLTGPIIREGRLRLPYFGYEEQVFSNAFKQEAVSWPEGSTTDLVMHFWFGVEKLDMLIVANTDEDDDLLSTKLSTGPAWAKVTAPKWANKHFDRDKELVA